MPAVTFKRKPLPVETERDVATTAAVLNSRGVWKSRAIERENIIANAEEHGAAAHARSGGK